MTARKTPALSLALQALSAEELAAAPRFRMVMGEDLEQGVNLVSLVENPAIQRPWLALSAATSAQRVALSLAAARMELAAAPSEKGKRVHCSTQAEGAKPRQVLTGPVLVPDEEILRLDADNKPFFIKFEVAEIEAICRRYAALGRHTASNDQHETPLDGNVFYESWIVEQSDCDKAAALGLDVPVGTWMLSCHVPDADYWEKEVLTGNRTGFSLEGLFDSEKLTMAAQAAPKPMQKVSLWARLFGGGAPKTIEALALQAVTLKDDSQLDVAEDGTVSKLDAEGNITEVAADGAYELKDGTTLTVKDGKKVEATKEELEGAGDLAKVLEVLTGAESETDLEKLLAAIKAAITAAGGTPKAADETALKAHLQAVRLAAAKLHLESVAMADGTSFNYNPITRMLTKEDGTMVTSGMYACADGSYFEVNTSQYTYQIDKATYEKATTKLAATELKLKQAEEKLAATPSAPLVTTGGDKPSTHAAKLAAAGAPERPLRTYERYALAVQGADDDE